MTEKAPGVRWESDCGIVLPPSIDEFGTPATKMPDCPKCGEDELGMVNPTTAVCNWCGVTILRGNRESLK